MLDALRIALPLVLAAVLMASAAAKVRAPDDLAGWAELGVPRALQQAWLLRLHPWAEGALGVLLVVVGGWLGQLTALAAVMLMAAYTVLVARAASRAPGSSCACFGARARITRVTVIRNVWLTVLAASTAAVIGTTPLVGGALAAGAGQAGWLLSLAVAGATVALVLWRESAESAPSGITEALTSGIPAAEDDEYVRVRTPAIPIVLADGSGSTLRALARRRPVLLLAVSPFCGSCEAIMERRSTYRELMPEVDVRLLLTEDTSSRWAERGDPQSVHDQEEYVADSLGYRGTPSAVLLGVDGLLAGGPVTGDRAVDRFVDDIYEALHGERPTRVDAIP